MLNFIRKRNKNPNFHQSDASFSQSVSTIFKGNSVNEILASTDLKNPCHLRDESWLEITHESLEGGMMGGEYMIHAIETWHSHGLLCHFGGLICYALQGRSMIVRIRPWAQTAGSMNCTWPSWNTWERSGPHQMGAWIWINEELHLTMSDIVLTKGSFFRGGTETKIREGSVEACFFSCKTVESLF